mgnify:CR=1 FL=1
MKILFSPKEDWEAHIRTGFESTPHAVTFGELTPESIRLHDMVVPLTVRDLRLLNGMRDAVGDNIIPIPSMESIALCDDKMLLNRALVASGFADCVPRVGLFQAYPYILKKRIDEWGANSHIVDAPRVETELADKIADAGYFRQEYIFGHSEYTTHILYTQERIKASTTFEFVFEPDVFIKGRDPDRDRSICACPYLDLFGRILESIGFDGLCCFNYKVLHGKPLVFEINPRFGASLGPVFAGFLGQLLPSPETAGA